MSELTERLRKRAKEDQACADNSKVIVEALADQMRLFERREGHNVYAVRMAVDHKSGMERDRRYAADLIEAADEIERLQAKKLPENEQLEAAIDGFWNVAYQQGQEQRGHDDEEGTAQKAEDALRRAIAAISVLREPPK